MSDLDLADFRLRNKTPWRSLLNFKFNAGVAETLVKEICALRSEGDELKRINVEMQERLAQTEKDRAKFRMVSERLAQLAVSRGFDNAPKPFANLLNARR